MPILTSDNDFVRADSGTWQQQMKWAIRDAVELRKCLKLPEFPATCEATQAAIEQFPVFVPLPFLSRIEPGNRLDPLLLQVMPQPTENDLASGYTTDPLDEQTATLQPGLLQKYQGRVLLVTTSACAIHCRYCFRRQFPYVDHTNKDSQWDLALEQIAADSSIDEVILSGGDPLTLVDETLSQLISRLGKIPHLKRLRIHTRLPIMIPQRVSDRLLEILTQSRLQPIVVIHSNHANELDHSVQAALLRFSEAGVMLLNQTVLLRQINDRATTLIELSQRLLECRVLPYYLHKNDPVIGTAHFEVSVTQGQELIEQMRAQLPGYAVPRFVQEVAGEPSKTVLA